MTETLKTAQGAAAAGVKKVVEAGEKAEKSALSFFFPYIYKRRRHIKNFFSLTKNGAITGAADNDPAGIITYSQVGAMTGYALLWLMVLATPLLIAVEDMSSRVAVVTKRSLVQLIKQKSGFSAVMLVVIIVAICNVVTIGADIAGMAEIFGIITGIKWIYFSIIITIIIGLVLLRGRYAAISRFLFILTPILLTYIIVGLIIKPDWQLVLKETAVPFSMTNPSLWLLAVALLGTTLSPYLIFWQNTQEIEDHKKVTDLKKEVWGVRAGMIYCNLISFFIIVVAGTVLFKQGIKIETAKEAALALKPLAGEGAFWLFSLGILGSGFLAVPILAASTAYVFAEAFHWQEGLDKRLAEAKGFYLVLLIALLAGILAILLGLSPVKMLVYSQVLSGLLMPFLLIFLIKTSNNPEVMGQHTNSLWINIIAWATFIIVLGFNLVLIGQWLKIW